MALIDDASRFIEQCDPQALPALLNACIAEQSSEALVALQYLYEGDYSGFTFDYEFKAPAALSMLYWKEQGLDSVVEVALRTPSPKNVSIAVDLLATVGAGGSAWLLGTQLLRRQDVEGVLLAIGEEPSMRSLARRRLRELMLALPDDEEAAMAAAAGLGRLTLSDVGATRLVFAALAARWLAVGEPTLDAFERTIQNDPSDEASFQSFLEDYPQILDPMAFEVWPRPNLYGFKEPDFIVRRSDNTYLVVEIETPAKQLITASNQLSAYATQAISQVTQYRSYLLERAAEVRQHLPEFQEPDCLVVIGLERPLTAKQRDALSADNSSRRGLRVVGFDWLLSRARAVTQNTVERRTVIRSLRIV